MGTEISSGWPRTPRSMGNATTDVLVVGAGPAGLTAANVLARYGARIRVIDSDPGPIDETRAELVHIRTLELWDKLGLAERAVANGRRIDATRLMIGGTILADLPTVTPSVGMTPFPFALGFEQSKSQRLLLKGLSEAATPATVDWSTRLTYLEQDADGVRATVTTPDGVTETIVASWVIGADGAKSTVRKELGISFEGETYGQVGFLADVDLDLEFQWPSNRLGIFIAPVGDAGILRYHESSGSGYRLFGTITPGLKVAVEASKEREVELADIQRWLDIQFRVPATVKGCKWYLAYRLHRRLADRFRSGRCFLIGDAAHVHPPSGGQGANLSIGDGFNLGWKLGEVITAQADPRLLDSYEAERLGVAKTIGAATDRGIKTEASGPATRRLRQLLLPWAIRLINLTPIGRDWFAKLTTQTWIRYPDSAVVAGETRARRARPGDRAPDAMMFDGVRDQHLLTVLDGVDHHMLLMEGVEPDRAFATMATAIETTLRGYRSRMRVHRLESGQDGVHHAYAVTAPTMLLIRPDGHIAFRAPMAHLPALQRYLDRWYRPVQAELSVAAS